MVCWLSLHWLILPHIETWRVPVEARASRMLGAPVKIGAIKVQSSGWVPAVDLFDVRVLDAEGRVALALPHVFAALSPRSLLAFEPRFAQLLIEGASLDVRRDPSGRIRVAGLDFAAKAGASDDDDAAADWFFRQREFVIRGGTLRWIDDARKAPPLALGNVEIVVRNGLTEHDLRIDATPPAGWGDRFSLRGRYKQPLFARSGDWRRWSGSAYADLPRADVRELRRHVALPFELSEGDGALRGWFDVEAGVPKSATVDLSLRAVTLRLDPGVEPLEFEQIEGRISAEKKGDRTSVAVRRFGFVTGDGIRWPQGDLDLAWQQNDAGDVTRGELAAERLDVGVMAEIATRVPLGKALRDLLQHLHPQGIITGLATRWDGPLDAPEHYQVKGVLSGLSLVARPEPRSDAIGRPGLSHATVQLEASEAGGKAHVGIAGGVLDLPGVFAEAALPIDRLDARLAWTIVPPVQGGGAATITVKVAGARFENADAKGELHGTWHTGPGTGFGRGGRYPGLLELDGKLAEGNAVRTARYLPLGLPDGVRSYIARAIRSGTLKSAALRIRGDLADFPFHDPKIARDAEFRIAAQVDDLNFAYIPPESGAASDSAWPLLTGIAGELVVDRNTLEFGAARARLAGVDWSRIAGRIGHLGDDARLEVEGAARGGLVDMLRFVNTTPVGGWTGRVLAATSASGPADLKLALVVPLARPEQTTVKGSLQLAGNDVRVTADTPLLGSARGRVDFTGTGFAVSAGTAKVLGGELAFEGGSGSGSGVGAGAGSGTGSSGVSRFSGQGTATAEGLRQATELGSIARLATALSGKTSYKASLAFAGSRPQIEVTSNLVGLGIELPQPIGKAAATPLPLHVRIGLDDSPGGAPAAAGAPVREALQVELGGALQARFVRVGEGDSARVVRGAIRIGEASAETQSAAMPAMPASGVAATVALRRLDIDEWRGTAKRLLGAGALPAAGAPAAPLVFDTSGGEGYVPDSISLRVAELETGSRRLGNVNATLSQRGGLWRAQVEADELAGLVEYRPASPGATTGAGRVFARLSRLSLPKAEAERVESLLEEPPASIPALDIVVDDFELRGRRLGRLEIAAANRSSPAANGRDATREWHLSKLNLTMPEAQFTASGTWGAAASSTSASAPGRRAAIDFHLALSDSGALLGRLGMGRVIKGGKGSLTGEVSWPGSPLSPDYSKMTGQVKVAIDSGQFLKASPGAARLLGVLSLQSLPRRLLLDFRDLFQEGFAFDNVTGDVRIGQGQAFTNNLRMRGVAAAVLMEGSADLERETEDLRVLVVPEINAGTASLAFAVINPAVGLGTFLAQYFLSKPLIAASTREFRVTGPWDDPKVERVERSLMGTADPVQEPAATPPTVTR